MLQLYFHFYFHFIFCRVTTGNYFLKWNIATDCVRIHLWRGQTPGLSTERNIHFSWKSWIHIAHGGLEQANKKRSPNIVLLSDQRWRRGTSINTIFSQYSHFAAWSQPAQVRIRAGSTPSNSGDIMMGEAFLHDLDLIVDTPHKSTWARRSLCVCGKMTLLGYSWLYNNWLYYNINH